MKLWAITFSLLPVMGLGYVLWRSWLIMPFSNIVKAIVLAVMVLCMGLFFAQFALRIDRWPMPLATFVYETGNSSLFILLYLVMLFIVLQLLQLVGVIPAHFLHHSLTGTAAVAGFMVLVFGYGYLHYMHKERVPIELTTKKPLEKPLRIVMLSDLHLGYHNRIGELRRWIGIINSEKPDLVLIAGDIIDGHMRPLEAEHMAEAFHQVKASIVASLGNHEYYTGIDEAIRFYREAGITLLRDSSTTIKGVNIVGRDDRSNLRRKSLRELLAGLDMNRYTIVLDHQPYHLEEAELAGADFQFSGHTHEGQVWPISWITHTIYEDAWGPLRKGSTQYYVSSGLGIWGAKFRIGTQSEYIVATLK